MPKSVRPFFILSALGLTGACFAAQATTTAPAARFTPFQAAVLGVVEGLTEYLPVSSTGHMILASHFLNLGGADAKPALDAFEVVIQIGAVLAVVGLYRRRVEQMVRGLLGRDRGGLKLIGLLLVAFLPAAVVGLPAKDWIQDKLFAPWPVTVALAAGGVAMIAVEIWRKRTGRGGVGIDSMTFRMALVIGLAQCIAMWPGTSRSMITMVAAILVGMEVKAAAEFSFLLALPTLSGAAVVEGWSSRGELLAVAGPSGLAIGLAVSCIVAAVAVKSFVSYLTRHGLEPFGYYRIALALVLIGLVIADRVNF